MKSLRLSLASALVLPALLPPSPLAAQRLAVPAASLSDSGTRAGAIVHLAAEAAAVYLDTNRLVGLDNRFRLLLLAGQDTAAAAALAEWRRAWVARGDTTAAGRAVNVQYEIYLRARRLRADSGVSLSDGFALAFRERFAALDDQTAALVARALTAPPPPAPATPGGAGEGSRAAHAASRDTTVSIADAVAWLRAVQIAETQQRLGDLAVPLLREDDRRRYLMSGLIPVKTPDGATVCAAVWRHSVAW